MVAFFPPLLFRSPVPHRRVGEVLVSMEVMPMDIASMKQAGRGQNSPNQV
jgi:hypothetical protein